MSSPKIPDANKAAIAGAKADLENYPFKYQIDALAQMGGKATINGKEYDFTGLGTADNNAVISDQMAQALLDIQRNYGLDYVKQRIENLKQADPAGYAARKQLFDKIIEDAKNHPGNRMAEDTQAQVTALLGRGASLSTGAGSETEDVQQAVRGRQLAGGVYLGNAAANQEAEALMRAGDQKQTERQQTALQFLQSGVSPEDVEYRRIQQDISNLSNATQGQSPIAQFASLSGAQTGAAPFNTGQVTAPSLNQNAALMGMQNAADLYSGNVNWAQNNVNPWLAGVTTLADSASTLYGAGAFSKYQPTSFTGQGIGNKNGRG